MRKGAALLMMGILCSLAGPSYGAVRADTPAELPDLSVVPEDMAFSYYGDPLDYAIHGLVISIDVTVRNAGPGNSTSANVTLFIDGLFVAILHVMKDLTAESPGNVSAVHFAWDTTGAAPGNHTIRAVANDTVGDAAPADNGAEKPFIIVSEPPVLTISLSPSYMDATVTPTEPGIVQFTGSVRVDLGAYPEAMVLLASSLDVGWATSLAPTTMVFASGEGQSFNVTVVVPAAWSASDSPALKVEGRILAAGYTSKASSQAIVLVRPYYGISVESNEREKNLTLGGEAALAINVWNQGNAQDSYKVAVENLDELRRAGWNVALENELVPAVPRSAYRTVMVRIGAPSDWSLYEDSSAVIKLNVSSINSRANVSATYTLTVRERGFNMPCIEATLTISVVLVAAAAAFAYKKRGKNKVKTVKDYLKELNIDEGD